MIKLLKYELKQTWRMGITLLGGTLLGCLGLMLNPYSPPSVMFSLHMALFIIVIIGSSLALFLYCIISFNQEFTGGQGYLMMTLPIKARDFIWAKFTGQLIWNMLSAVILIANLPLIIKRYTAENISISTIGMPNSSQIFSNGLTSYSLAVFIIYFSIVVLSMHPRNNHITFIKVILAMVLTNIVNILVGGVSMLLVAIPFAIKHGFSMKIPDITRLSGYMQNNVQGLNIVNIIINILVAGIFYLMTKNIIDNKVQL